MLFNAMLMMHHMKSRLLILFSTGQLYVNHYIIQLICLFNLCSRIFMFSYDYNVSVNCECHLFGAWTSEKPCINAICVNHVLRNEIWA